MSTVVLFAGLIYLVNALGMYPEATRVVTVILAAVGLVAFALRAFGVKLPAWLTT